MLIDVVDLDARVVRAGLELLTPVPGADDLARPTPCPAWDLRALLAHMSAQHRGFAAAARGRGGDLQEWAVDADADPVGAYRDSAETVLAAFAAPATQQQQFLLPELHPSRPFPAEAAVGFHLVDYLAHGWDLARSLGRPWTPDRQAVLVGLRVAEQIPEAARQGDHAPFGPRRGSRDDARSSPEQIFLACTGRDPDCAAAT